MSTTTYPATPLGGSPENASSSEIGWMVGVFLVISVMFYCHWEEWQISHHRRALLEAYRRRHQWRKADVSRLLNLGVPRQRIERVINDNKRLGRGVVQDYQSLEEMLTQTAGQFSALVSPDTSPNMRLKILKQTPMWVYVVEALYRGEYTAAKESRQKSASEQAEVAVARCLGISDSQVHKVCGTVRKERKRANKVSEDESRLRIHAFDEWMKNGTLQLS